MAAIWFETHSTTEDNEHGIATGWQPGVLSAGGRHQAMELGARIKARGIARVYASDLARAAATAELAAPHLPLFLDWRLRECHYGTWTGEASQAVRAARSAFVDEPYPGGESWRQAVERVGWFVEDLVRLAWPEPVLVIGHIATRIGLAVHLGGERLEDLLEDEADWQPGWSWPVSELSHSADGAAAPVAHQDRRRE